MSKISGSEAVIKCLLEEGVDIIYGYPGGAIMPVYDELYKYQDKIQHVLTRHEQGATHSAQGFPRISGSGWSEARFARRGTEALHRSRGRGRRGSSR